jgi:hypothetical protein
MMIGGGNGGNGMRVGGSNGSSAWTVDPTDKLQTIQLPPTTS